MTTREADGRFPRAPLRTHRWWMSVVATLLTPWVGPHIDRYVPVGRVLLQAGAADADRGFWVIAAVASCVYGLVWFGLFSGLAVWLARRRRDHGSSGGDT